jgi:hypothetical protein
VPTGVCSDSSPKPGYPCGADYECAENGALGQYEETGYCQPIQSKQKFIGTKGFCLEYDYSRPIADGAYECLTWYPSKLSASNIDTNNAFISAGYNPAVDASRGFGQVYCAEATQFGRGEFQTEWYNSDITDGLIANETAVEEIYYRNFQSNGFPQPFQCEEFSDDDLNLGSDAFKDFARIYLGLPEGTEFSFGADSPQYNEIVDAYRTEYCYSVYETARGDDGYFCQNVQTNGRYRNQFTRLYSEYAGVICRGFTDAGNDLRGGPETPTDINVSDKFKDQYALLQTWAWSRLGNSGATANQVVLRMDGFAIRGNGDSRSDADGYNSGSKIRTDGTSSMTYYPLSFAPDRFLNPANDRDAGTIMHPPRHWREQSETISSDDAFTLRYLPRSDKQVFVNPLMWAPGNELEPNISFSDHNNRILETEAKDAVYRSEYESSLNETMLDRVYFVPLAYLDGINGAIPMQMNERMYIDFTSLRNNDSRVEQRSVPLALSTGGSDKVGNFNPKPNVNTPNGIVTTYLLDRNKDDFSQIAYTDYRFSGETEFAVRSRRDPLTEEIIEQQLVDDGRDPRNEIHKRYVMIFSGPSETTGYASVYGVPSGRFDPFTRECNSELGNMLAIGMDFNKDGEFLGYISRWCHGAPNDSTGMKMAVVAQVFDQCTEFAQVYDNRVNPIYGTTNKAWTNRVWAGAQTDHPYAEGFFPGQEIRPFGSLGVTSEQLQSISPVLRSQGFSSAINGLPLSCRSNYLYEGFFGSSVRRCNSLINAGVDPGVLASIAGNETGVILDNLFAMTHMRVRYDLRENSFVYGQQIGPNGGATDVSGSVSSGPEEPALYVPQVYGLNSETCFGEDGTTVRCTAGPADTISVGRYTGTVVDLNQDGVIDGDRNRDGRPDDIVAVGAYNATTRFFAWADEDRMPIRQVKIDWTDGSNILNEDRRGLYKNQKPFCADSGQVGSCYDTQGTFVENGVRYIRKTKILPGLTCQTSSDCSVEGYLDQGNPDERYICEPSQASQTSFGNATRACEEGYFEFNHAYSCGPREFADPNVEKAIISVLPAATRDQFLAFGYEPTDSVCAFKPKVQIIDNWGYCNGTCESGDCYNDGARAMCDNPNSGDNPWTSFGGMIYVAPSAQYDIEQAQFEDLFLLPPQDAAAINVNP